MSRRTVSKEAIRGLIHAQMKLIPACSHVRCGEVLWRKPDGDLCNWTLSRIEGSGCLDCLDRMSTLLSSLRSTLNIPDPDAALRTTAGPLSTRRMKPVVRTAADEAAHATSLLVDEARLAVRDSRTILRAVAARRLATVEQCRSSRAALETSMSRLAGAGASAFRP